MTDKIPTRYDYITHDAFRSETIIHKINEIIDYLNFKEPEPVGHHHYDKTPVEWKQLELLPCPFPSCKSSDVKVVDYVDGFYIYCSGCHTHYKTHKTEEEAIADWNEVKR